jgi:hypothetical protein
MIRKKNFPNKIKYFEIFRILILLSTVKLTKKIIKFKNRIRTLQNIHMKFKILNFKF